MPFQMHLRRLYIRRGHIVIGVDEGVDTGKVIGQVRVPVLASDDEDALHERIKIVERELIVETIRQVLPTINPPANNLEN